MSIIRQAPSRCNFDYVFCIDRTARSYFYSINEDLAEQVFTIRERLQKDHPEFEIGRIRVRFVIFGDYLADAEPMMETVFFNLDTDHEEIRAMLDYQAGGGGDLPENGLEALALALRSEFELVSGELNRHVICLYTDASAHPLGKFAWHPSVPEDMPTSLAELRELWERMDSQAKRLYLLAPDVEPWRSLACQYGALHYHDKCRPGELDAETLVDVVTSRELASHP